MPRDVDAPRTVLDRHTPAVERLASLTGALAEDLDRGVWVPGPLERTLAARLLVACAGDGQLNPVRVRETVVEGSVALAYAGDGRLARLLAQVWDVTAHPAPDAEPALSAVTPLLQNVARETPAGDDEF